MDGLWPQPYYRFRAGALALRGTRNPADAAGFCSYWRSRRKPSWIAALAGLGATCGAGNLRVQNVGCPRSEQRGVWRVLWNLPYLLDRVLGDCPVSGDA